MRLIFSSPLTGVWKTVLKSECMRVASPGAQVGQLWENVSGTNGTPPYSAAASSESGSTEEGRSGVWMGSEVEDPVGGVWVLVNWGSSGLRRGVTEEKGR